MPLSEFSSLLFIYNIPSPLAQLVMYVCSLMNLVSLRMTTNWQVSGPRRYVTAWTKPHISQ